MLKSKVKDRVVRDLNFAVSLLGLFEAVDFDRLGGNYEDFNVICHYILNKLEGVSEVVENM